MEHILKGLVASSLVGGQGGTIDPKHIKDMYYEDVAWSPIIDPALGRFTDTMLAEAYEEYKNGGLLKAVINGVDYTDFTYANNSKGFSISVNGTDFVYTANMMNSTNSHNAESWEWYTGEMTVKTIDPKYLPTDGLGSGGGGFGLGLLDNYDIELVTFKTIDQATIPSYIEISTKDDGSTFEYDGLLIWTDVKSGYSYTDITFNGQTGMYAHEISHGKKDVMNLYLTDGSAMVVCAGTGTTKWYYKQTYADTSNSFYPAPQMSGLPNKFRSVLLCSSKNITAGTFYKVWGLTKK